MLPIDASSSRSPRGQRRRASKIGGTSVGDATSIGSSIVDTGTSFTYLLPAAVVTSIANTDQRVERLQVAVPEPDDRRRHGVTNATATACIDAMLPPLTIGFGAETPAAAPRDAPDMYTTRVRASGASSVSSSAGIGFNILGDSKLSGFLTVFDLGQQRVGFAPVAGCGSQAKLQTAPTTPVPPAPPGMPWWTNNPHVQFPRGTR